MLDCHRLRLRTEGAPLSLGLRNEVEILQLLSLKNHDRFPHPQRDTRILHPLQPIPTANRHPFIHRVWRSHRMAPPLRAPCHPRRRQYLGLNPWDILNLHHYRTADHAPDQKACNSLQARYMIHLPLHLPHLRPPTPNSPSEASPVAFLWAQIIVGLLQSIPRLPSKRTSNGRFLHCSRSLRRRDTRLRQG